MTYNQSINVLNKGANEYVQPWYRAELEDEEGLTGVLRMYAQEVIWSWTLEPLDIPVNRDVAAAITFLGQTEAVNQMRLAIQSKEE